MRHSTKLALGCCVASALLLGACVGGYVRVVEPTDFKATRELDVWSHGQRLRLHAVSMLLDSVTGIPLKSPLSCDWCRVGFPMTEVDSVTADRLGGVKEDVKHVARLALLEYLQYLVK
jgi:hypothetical protein